MRIALVDPSPLQLISPIEPYEHLGLGYLGAVLRNAGHEVVMISSILDHLNLKQTVRAIVKTQADLIGFSVKEIFARRTIQIIQKLRKSGINSKIVLGGHYPTFCDTSLLQEFPEIDFIVRGEGEFTLVELVAALQGTRELKEINGLSFRFGAEIIRNEPRTLIANLDSLPFPIRDHTARLFKKSGEISLTASRGCYANCSFCSIQSFYHQTQGKRYRRRSAENILAEIESLQAQFNCNQFKFIDDQFIGPGPKGQAEIHRFARMIIDRGLNINFHIMTRVNDVDEALFSQLQAAGLKSVFIGIESSQQRGLDVFNKSTTLVQNQRALKILENLGITAIVSFILLDPYSTTEDLVQNLDYLNEIKPRVMQNGGRLSVEPQVIAHQGTAIFDRLVRENRLQGNFVDGFTYQYPNKKIWLFMKTWKLFEKLILPLFAKTKAYLKDYFLINVRKIPNYSKFVFHHN
jgi:radical SAM superfamily enzyme YgiQ (UPF0313 family)